MGDDEPRWLTAEERESWQELMRMVSWLPAALDGQLIRDAGITHFEYAILGRLSEAPERTLAMGTLAVMANGSLSRLSHVVNRLEQRGWVLRSRSPENGRVTNVVLTDAGFAKVVASAPGHVAETRRLAIDPLTAVQLRQLGAVARRLNAAYVTAMSMPRAAGRSEVAEGPC